MANRQLQQKEAMKRFKEKMQRNGWTTFYCDVPPEVKDKLRSYRDELMEEYKKSHPPLT